MSLAIAAAIAITLLVAGYAISGADVLAWFGSKYAITVYIFVGVYALVVVFFLVWERNKRL